MIFPQPKLTKKIKSINKNPRPPDRKELGPILRLVSYNRKFAHTFKKGINKLTALTKDRKGARNNNWVGVRDAFNCIYYPKPRLMYPKEIFANPYHHKGCIRVYGIGEVLTKYRLQPF